MFNETVTLYIDDTSVRLLVSQGQRIKKWADLHLEPGLVKGSVVAEGGEVANRIKQLLESQQVSARKVILGFSGLHSLTRPASLPQLPKAMLAEAVAREARRVLPVPLDQLYLAWRPIPGSKGKVQVFIGAVPRKTADSLVEACRVAGLQPTHMVIKPLALTKALTENTAIIMDVQPGEYDIIIVSDGVPQPIRSVALPDEEQTWEQKLDILISDLDRTIKFYDTNNPDKPLHTSIPIFVSGELVGQPDLFKDISERSGRPVKVLMPNFKGPDQVDLGRYMVNIVMAMKETSALETAFPVASLNLLPAPYQPKPLSLTKVLGVPGGVAVAGLVVPMVMLIQGSASDIVLTQHQLDTTNQQINQRTAQRTELKKTVTDLQTQATAAVTNLDKINLASKTIISRQEFVSGDLAIVLSGITPQVTLNKISETPGVLTLTGTAPNQKDIYTYSQAILEYARTLDSSGRYLETTISSLKSTPAKTTTTQTTDGTQQDVVTPAVQPPDTIDFVLTFERKGK